MFGAPGSGKGTQTAMLAKKFGIPAISTGNLLRQEVKNDTPLGRKVKMIIESGRLVPQKIVNDLLSARLAEKDTAFGLVFDGYPRDERQNKFLIKKLKTLSGPDSRIVVIYIFVSDAEIKRRLSGRRICQCGATYHLLYQPPEKKNICDRCGRELVRRRDDQPAVITHRLKIYHKESAPVIDYWRRAGRLIKIDGKKPIREVSREIIKSFKFL